MQHPGLLAGSYQEMTTIDQADAIAVSDAERLTADHVAVRALRVGLRTALGVLGDAEAAADVAQDVAITAVQRADSVRDPAALDAWLHRIAVRAALREARRAGRRRAAERAGHDPRPAATTQVLAARSRCSRACPPASAPR
jgi:DNA-directed RNA polymerase specialized sigma24 family protein